MDGGGDSALGGGGGGVVAALHDTVNENERDQSYALAHTSSLPHR